MSSPRDVLADLALAELEDLSGWSSSTCKRREETVGEIFDAYLAWGFACKYPKEIKITTVTICGLSAPRVIFAGHIDITESLVLCYFSNLLKHSPAAFASIMENLYEKGKREGADDIRRQLWNILKL